MSNHLNDYRVAAAQHGEYTRAGESDLANTAHSRLQQALLALIADGSDSQIMDLYNDSDPWVQLWAATHTLEIDEQKAMAKLTSLQNDRKPILSLSAKYTLKSWQEGKIAFRK
jgi:hypothetical protein